MHASDTTEQKTVIAIRKSTKEKLEKIKKATGVRSWDELLRILADVYDMKTSRLSSIKVRGLQIADLFALLSFVYSPNALKQFGIRIGTRTYLKYQREFWEKLDEEKRVYLIKALAHSMQRILTFFSKIPSEYLQTIFRTPRKRIPKKIYEFMKEFNLPEERLWISESTKGSPTIFVFTVRGF